MTRLRGDYTRALALYEKSLALSRKRGDARNIATVLHNLGHVTLQQNDLHRAATHFDGSLALARELSDERRIAMCVEGLASVATQAGLIVEAATLFGAAQMLRGRLGAPFEAADLVIYDRSVTQVRATLGEVASATAWAAGQRMTQVEALRAAPPYARLAARRARAARTVARRQKRRTRDASGGLTAREREVALLIVQGKTNRQIANLLVVSERTIDKHVGQILSKLGFRARAQVAAWAVANGLSNTP